MTEILTTLTRKDVGFPRVSFFQRGFEVKEEIGVVPNGVVIEAVVKVPCSASAVVVKFKLTGEPCGGYIRKARVLSPISFAEEIRLARKWVKYLGLDRDQSISLPTLNGIEIHVDMLGPDRPAIFSLSGQAEIWCDGAVIDE